MKWKMIAIGKPRHGFIVEGLDEYCRRIQKYAKLEVLYLKASQQDEESKRLAESSVKSYRVVLDPAGEALDTHKLKQRFDHWEIEGIKEISLLVGGADGHTSGLRSLADWCWSLSPLTLQHELALLVAAEQIYRVYTMKKGEPYHR